VIVVILPGTGPVELMVTTLPFWQPFPLLPGGAGPHPVTGSGELLATAHQVRTGPGPPRLRRNAPARRTCRHSGTRGAHNGLIELLGLQDVTVIGNSIGGWITAEIALPRSPTAC